jgi:hypothetical protein
VVLPFAVLATAATSPCDDGVRRPSVTVMQGLWEEGVSEWSPGQRFVVSGEYLLRPTAAGLDVRLVSEQERHRIDPAPALEVARDERAEAACDPQRPRLCWSTDDPDRFGAQDPTQVAFLAVHESDDGGETWTAHTVVGSEEMERLRDEAGEVCGEPLQLSLSHVAVMSTEDGPVVVVTTNNAGLLVRDAGGDWRRFAASEIRDRAATTPAREAAPRTTLPRWERRHPLRYVAVVTPVDPDATPTPTPSPPRPTPTPPCDDPTLVTVTPDPRNGPASTQLRCPPSSSP